MAPAVRFRAGSRPFPGLPPGRDMLPQVQHIVVLMMENHSFDNYFGMLGRGDGFRLGSDGRPLDSNPTTSGTAVRAYHAPSTCQANVEISQNWKVSHESWDGGRNDGFVRAKGKDPMAYFDESDIPFYYSLGRTFCLCDRWFSSTMGQTYPNRRFLMAGSAFGVVDDTFLSNAGTSPRPNGFGTVFDMLNHFGISWKNYYSDAPSSLLFPYLTSEPGNQARLVKVDELFSDARAGSLPSFSLVDPNFSTSSEENPQEIRSGEKFAASVIEAVIKSPAWRSTVLIWLYDEHGGYYEHVPPARAVPPDDIPPAVPSGELYGDTFTWTGFRVPAVVVSAWARKGHVSHVPYDHTSILKLLETKWNLPALSDRDANAANLLDTLDLSAHEPPFLTPPELTPAAPVSQAEVAACAAAQH
jgi:phospholipase C